MWCEEGKGEEYRMLLGLFRERERDGVGRDYVYERRSRLSISLYDGEVSGIVFKHEISIPKGDGAVSSR